MKRKFERIRTKSMRLTTAGAVLGGLLIANGPVFAQEPEVITVVAPRAVVQKTAGRDPRGMPFTDVSVSLTVSYAALDLTKQSDVAEVEKRIDEAAKEACRQLDQLPFTDPDADCAGKAAKEGKAELKAIIAGKAK